MKLYIKYECNHCGTISSYTRKRKEGFLLFQLTPRVSCDCGADIYRLELLEVKLER